MSGPEFPTDDKYALQEMLAAIVMFSDDAIVGKTLDGTITSWNAGAVSVYGYTAEEAIGKSISIIVPKDRREELRIFLEKIAQGEPVVHHETKRQRKDGTIIDVSVSLSPIRDRAGTICGAAAIARDISLQKKVEGELLASNARVEKKIVELEKLNELMLARELKMVELKSEIKALKKSAKKGES